MGKLSNKVAVITGGNSGIGLATARLFVEEGAQVVITGRRQAELDEAVKSLGKNAFGVQGDVSNLKDLDRLYSVVKERYGRVDVLFANAGLGEFIPVDQVTEEHFDKTFNINVKGLYFTVQKALPIFTPGGSIILCGSVSGIIGMPGASVYGATKAAVRAFARNWILDLKDRKIRVNVLSPGPIETPILSASGFSQEQIDGFKAAIVNQVPLGRMGQPEETAKAVLYLASDESSYVTGTELFVDGGMAQV